MPCVDAYLHKHLRAPRLDYWPDLSHSDAGSPDWLSRHEQTPQYHHLAQELAPTHTQACADQVDMVDSPGLLPPCTIFAKRRFFMCIQIYLFFNTGRSRKKWHQLKHLFRTKRFDPLHRSYVLPRYVAARESTLSIWNGLARKSSTLDSLAMRWAS